jgi:hypothetical protein
MLRHTRYLKTNASNVLWLFFVRVSRCRETRNLASRPYRGPHPEAVARELSAGVGFIITWRQFDSNHPPGCDRHSGQSMSSIANHHPTVVKIPNLDQKISEDVIQIGDNGCQRPQPLPHRLGEPAPWPLWTSGRWTKMLKWRFMPPPLGGILWHCLADPLGIMCLRRSVWIESLTTMANGRGD